MLIITRQIEKFYPPEILELDSGTLFLNQVLCDNFKFAVDERVLRVESNAFYMG